MSEPQPGAAQPIGILLLEDDPADEKLTARKLREAGFDFTMDVARNAAKFMEQVPAKTYDVILGDYRLPGWTGLEAVRWLRRSGYAIPFILITGTLGDELAVECIKEGVTDYVLKDKLQRLPSVLRRALEEQAMRMERNQTERGRLELMEQYRSIIEGAPYGIFRMDEEGHIFMANPALLAMLGCESEADIHALDRTDGIFFHPAERQDAMRRFQTPSPQIHPEVTWRRKDGKKITVRLAGRRLPEKTDAPAVYKIFAENITEQRLLEAQFQQAQKMEAVGRLAGSVAHDFNNQLMIIGGCAELMAQQIGDPEKIKEYIHQIQSAASVAASVIRQLLAISRKHIPERQVLDLNAILIDLGKMLPRLLGENIEVVMALGERLGRIYVDRAQVEQIVMNLVVNARDAMREGGVLTLETANVEPTQEPIRILSVLGAKLTPGAYVTLAVNDTGTGMDEETRTHIFEPFFTTKGEKGTGLGLSTVFGIVQQNGWSIEVRSELGKGTTFRIYFPRAKSQNDAGYPVPVMAASSGGPETLLLVEDAKALREVTREYLQSKGYQVLAAAHGERALEICGTHKGPIHLLIADVIMPGIAGPELSKRAAALIPGLRTIYVSGYTDRLLDIEALNPGMVFLQKPYSLKDLAQKIRMVLATHARSAGS